MQEKKYIKLTTFLMSISALLLFFAIVYYDLANKVKNYKYSDKEEYNNITDGLDYLQKLPIHFNVINKYFSNINNLTQQEKEEIVMAYAIKNKYATYNCGPSNDVTKYLCIDKDNLNSKELLNKFNLDFKFKNNDINIYVDDYGTYSVSSNNDSKVYKIVLNNANNKLYRLYSTFSHYKQNGNSYIFYMHQGYFMGNCIKEEKLNLYDFMTGKVVYSDVCNGNQNFVVDPSENVKKLQLYKYELKKDKNDRFYLNGYNPVLNIDE